MIIGLGTDIVEIARIQAQYERLGSRFAARILTESERETLAQTKEPARLLAKRFAVKEAAAKALGTGIGRGVSFQHIELQHNEWGAPILVFTGGAQERFELLGGRGMHISLSDEQHYATATVVLES